MPSALIFGHSQSGGMGLDLEAALKARGWAVKRSTQVGANDAKLVALVPSVADAAAEADRVYLFGGGNSESPSVDDLRALVAALGAGKTTLILPPVNVDDPSRAEMVRAKNAGNAAGLQDRVPVLAVEGPASSFQPDKIHMRPGCPESVGLAGRLMQDLDRKPFPTWLLWAAGGVVVVGLIGILASRKE